MMLDLALAALLAAPPVPPPAPSAPPVLSDLHTAQVDAHLQRLRVLQLELQLRQAALSEERTRLEQAIAATYPGFRLDWASGRLVPLVVPEPKP